MKKSERLNQELIYLSSKKTFQLRDLMQEFSISKRTALRDIEDLEQLGLALYAESGRGGGYRLLKQEILTPVHFSLQEMRAICFALQSFTHLTSSPFDKSYPHILEKLLVKLPQDMQRDVEELLAIMNYHFTAPVAPTPFLEDLIRSILDGQILEIVYYQYEEISENIQFYDLFFRQGIWFLNGRNVENGDWAIYRADKIRACQLSQNQDKRLSQEELATSLQIYQKAYLTTPFKCRLSSYGKELFLRNHYRDMKLVKEDDQYFIQGHYNLEELHYMTHYLIEFGKHIQILEPAELKKAYLQDLTEILANYN